MNVVLVMFCLTLVANFFFQSSVARTVIVDDAYGDAMTGAPVVYSPEKNKWNQGANCSWCGFHTIEPSIAQNGTWHDATHYKHDATPLSVEFSFYGFQLTVYCIVPNPSDASLFGAYFVNFFIDGETTAPSSYLHHSNKSKIYQGRVVVYENSTLKNKHHNFSMVASSSANSSVILFDYAAYTYHGLRWPVIATTTTISSSSSENPSAALPSTAYAPMAADTPSTSSKETQDISLATSAIIATTSSHDTSSSNTEPPFSSSSSLEFSSSAPFETSSTSLSIMSSVSHTSSGAITGLVSGGLIFAIALSVSALWFVRRRKRMSSAVEFKIPDFTATSSFQGGHDSFEKQSGYTFGSETSFSSCSTCGYTLSVQSEKRSQTFYRDDVPR